MSLAVAITAPVDVAIMAASSAPSYCHYAQFCPSPTASFGATPPSYGTDAQRHMTHCSQQTNEMLPVSYDDDDEVLKVRRMQQLRHEVGDADECPEDMHLDSNAPKEESNSSPTSFILQDSLCCFSDMAEMNSYLLPPQTSSHCYHQRRRNLAREPNGVRIDESRNTYHAPPDQHHQYASAFSMSLMVRMGIATAPDERPEPKPTESDGSSSWLQQADYAAIKRDNIKTLLAIQQQMQNPSAQYVPNEATVDDNTVERGGIIVDEFCPRGLETVIDKMLRRPTSPGGRPSISHQRRVSQLIVQLYRTHRALRSKTYKAQSQSKINRVLPASPMEHDARGASPPSSSTLEDDVRTMYEMVSQADRIRALSLAEQDARDVGHPSGVGFDL
jgi:hypothetical protein